MFGGGRHFHRLAGEDAKPAEMGKTLRRLLVYFKPYRGLLAAAALLILASASLQVLGPYLLGVATDQFIDPSGKPRPFWLDWILPQGISQSAGLNVTMALLLVTYLLNWAATAGQFYLMTLAGQRVLLHMRTQIFECIQALSLRFFDQHEAGDLMSRLVNDTQVINQVLGGGVVRLTSMSLSLVGIVISMLVLNWRLALAKEYGADHIVDASEVDPVEAVKEITDGRMADGVVITVGVPDAILQGINMLGRNGRAVLFGGAPLDTTVTFSPNLIHYGDRALVGCSGGPPRGQLAMDLIASGKTSVKGLISHHFTLEELPEAFAQITEGKLERYTKGMVTYRS